MSRPSASVPSKCAKLGKARRANSVCLNGSASGSRSASSAKANTTATQPTAIQKTAPSPRRRRARTGTSLSSSMAPSSAAMADGWVECCVEQIDEKIDEHEADGDEQHAALENDEVAQIDRFHQQSADTRERE